MPLRRRFYLDPHELEPSEEELEAAKTATKAPGEGAAWGGALGSLGGAALGALPLLAGPAGIPIAAMTIPAAASAGAALGGATGGAIGGAVADGADKTLERGNERRQRKLGRQRRRSEVLADFLGEG